MHDSRFRSYLGSAVALLVAIACAEIPTAGPHDANARPAGGPVEDSRLELATRERPVRPVFDVALSVQALTRVGEAFTVSARARSLVEDRDLRLALFAPDLELGARSTGEVLQARRGVHPAATLDGVVARGGERTLSQQFVIAEPGVYRFGAVAFAPASSANRARDPEEQPLGVTELWVRVDSAGGSVHTSFDEVAFPAGVRPLPGPFRMRPQVSATEAGLISTAGAGCGPYTGTALYLNYDVVDTLQTPPVANAAIVGHRYPLFGGGGPVFFSTTADAQGNFTIPGLEDHSFEGFVVLDGLSAQVGVAGIPHATPISLSAQCAGSGYHILTSNREARVWSSLLPTISRAFSEFQRIRPKIKVDIVNPPSPTQAGNVYSPLRDSIAIDTNSVWGQFGHFIVAHEYGHAFHWVALGGYPAFGSCGPGGIHYRSGAYSLQCALREGFANFFAAFVLQDSIVGEWEDIFESAHLGPFQSGTGLGPGYWCENKSEPGLCAASAYTTDGARNETAVAGFLYDIADDAATNNGTPGVDDDAIQALGAKWIGDVIATCEVLEGGQWVRNNGIDHLTYCFERTLGGYQSAGYFPTRVTAAQDWRTTAATPSGWSARQIKSTWQMNLYVHGPLPPPPPPSYTATVAGFWQVEPGATCTWTVSTTVPNPVSYQWTIDGVAVGTNSPTLTVSAPISSFSLGVSVVNAVQEGASDTRAVTVYHGAGQCLDI